MAYTFSRGHMIEYDELTELAEKPCKRCDRLPTGEGHDACLGTLPGVKFACCGHGEQPGYIMFNNGVVIRGDFKVEVKKD
jgi:hypothetical protein